MARPTSLTPYLSFNNSGLSHLIKRFTIIIYSRFHRILNIFSGFYYCMLSFLFGDRQESVNKTQWESPVCRDILRRKYVLSRTHNSLSSAGCCSIIAALIFTEMKNAYLADILGRYLLMFWYVELFVFIILCANSFLAITWYLWTLFSKPMVISPLEQKLFRINASDPGFELKREEKSSNEVGKPELLNLSSWRNSFESNSSPSFVSVTPINSSYNSWMSSPRSSASFDTTSSSWNFYRTSSPTYASTPKTTNSERSSLRQLNYSDNIDSPYERPIKNRKQLEEYLKVHEEDRKMKSVSFDDSKSFIGKLTPVDNSPMSVLSKCRYQRAYRLPHLETPEDDSSEVHCGVNVLNKLKINEKMLTVWCERVRKWMCQTILVKLVHEINDINSTLTEIGLQEFQIGNVSLFALHQIAATKAQHLPTLPAVLPYINMHSNQKYLVKRLKELATGGCMGDFKWNSGGTYEEKPWSDDLPSDSAIIIYLLCCYLDAHLPPDPHFPEGKPFSSKYFKKVPEKVTFSKESAYIYQSCLNPPHFKVVVGEDLCALGKGRNNLFCALAVFLHHFKIKECGMLGRVNLGPSGLNMLWIID